MSALQHEPFGWPAHLTFIAREGRHPFHETLASFEPSEGLWSVPAANESYRPRLIRLSRPGRRRRYHREHAFGHADGLPLQPSSLLAASSIQLFPFSQLDRLHGTRSINSSSDDPALEQSSTIPDLRPRLPCAFAGTAPRQHHRRHCSLPACICGCHFLLAHPSRSPSLEIFPFFHLLCRRRALLAQLVHRSP